MTIMLNAWPERVNTNWTWIAGSTAVIKCTLKYRVRIYHSKQHYDSYQSGANRDEPTLVELDLGHCTVYGGPHDGQDTNVHNPKTCSINVTNTQMAEHLKSYKGYFEPMGVSLYAETQVGDPNGTVPNWWGSAVIGDDQVLTYDIDVHAIAPKQPTMTVTETQTTYSG